MPNNGLPRVPCSGGDGSDGEEEGGGGIVYICPRSSGSTTVSHTFRCGDGDGCERHVFGAVGQGPSISHNLRSPSSGGE